MGKWRVLLAALGAVCGACGWIGCTAVAGIHEGALIGDAAAGPDGTIVTGEGGAGGDAHPSSDAPHEGEAGEAAVECKADAGQQACGGACVDPATDGANCGTCGHACPSGFGCSAGRCGDVVVQMIAGGAHTCAALARGDVYCWGSNATDQVGPDAGASTSTPTLLPVDAANNPFVSVITFGAGQGHTCALEVGGSLACWGDDTEGQLSNGQVTEDGGPFFFPIPTLAQQGTGFPGAPSYRYTSIARGPAAIHACATTEEAGVVCWGDNSSNELWNDAGGIVGRTCNDEPCDPYPVPVTPLVDMRMISVGEGFSCAFDAPGTVSCWGAFRVGQMGNGSRLPVAGGIAQPKIPPDAGGATAIASGEGSSCALLADGSVWCWGLNVSGQLGHDAGTGGDTCCSIDPLCNPPDSCSSVPTQVAGLSHVVDVASGCNHACALESDRSMWCWGANDVGQLGAAVGPATAQPQKVLSGVAGMALGCEHTCAWTTAGGAQCWGLNTSGQIGSGTANAPAPVPVVGLP